MSAAYERSMALCRYIRTPDCSPAEVERLWRQVFEAVLMCERFTRRAIDKNGNSLYQGCEEIVRCRDCNYLNDTNNCPCGWHALEDLDGFCAWGERDDGQTE